MFLRRLYLFPSTKTNKTTKITQISRRSSSEPEPLNVTETHRCEYYKKIGSQHAYNDNEVKPVGWDKALPFRAIPGPKPLPIIGNFWRFMPPFGKYSDSNGEVLFERLFDKYGKIIMVEGIGRPKCIYLRDPSDFEMVYRNDGAWPIRETVPSFVYYRSVTRKNVFGHFTGVAAVHGEEWYKFRSMMNPIFMQPRVVAVKIPEVNETTQDLVKIIKHLTEKQKDGIMPDNFIVQIQKWTLETMGVLALDARLGCLELDLPPDSPAYNNIKILNEFFGLMYKLDIQPSLWRYFSTPNWRKFVKVLDNLTSENMKYVDIGIQKLRNESNNKEENEQSVLERLIKIDRKAAIIMSIDMMIGGIDTTGNTLASGLYLLSRNPEAQEKLRKECIKLLPQKDSPITADILQKMIFVKATVKEILRVKPAAAGNLRTTTRDLVLSGYRIPRGTEILMFNRLACLDEQYFKKPLEFIPERWLRTNDTESSHKNSHPFAYLPFGHGARTCLGRRMAIMDIEIAVAKIVRNFKISWPHTEDATFQQRLLYGISSPLKLKFELVAE